MRTVVSAVRTGTYLGVQMVGSGVVPVYLSARPTEPPDQIGVLHAGRKLVPAASPSVQNIAARSIYNLRACMERVTVELSGSAMRLSPP